MRIYRTRWFSRRFWFPQNERSNTDKDEERPEEPGYAAAVADRDGNQEGGRRRPQVN